MGRGTQYLVSGLFLDVVAADSRRSSNEDTGEYRAQKKKGGAFRGRRWQQEHIDVLQRYVDLHPGATLKDIQLHLHQETGFNPSITNVHSVLKEVLHVSGKRVRIVDA